MSKASSPKSSRLSVEGYERPATKTKKARRMDSDDETSDIIPNLGALSERLKTVLGFLAAAQDTDDNKPNTDKDE